VLTLASKRSEEAERIAKVYALGSRLCPQCQSRYSPGKFRKPYFICAPCGHRWSENPVVDALGCWLKELHSTYPWDWFATLTFARDGISPAGAQYWFRRYLEDAARAGAAKPYAFRADEYGPRNGRYHLHALVGNVRHLQIFCGERLAKDAWGQHCCWVHRWPCGYARIYSYDAERGANYYLSKYVVKSLANWDVIGFEQGNLVFRAA
jgi:hypothetical protein